MYRGKRLLAIIPARSGSKGVKNKNIRPFCGKPLLAHAIECAAKTQRMDDIFVSTDSEEYAQIAREYGAGVPFLRPRELSGDAALASEYIRHAINAFKARGKDFDYFVLLQPTTPLRKPEHILHGVEMAVREDLKAVVAFSEMAQGMHLCHRLPPDNNLAALAKMKEQNRQQAEKYYRINGVLYICQCDAYLKDGHFYGPNSKAMIIESKYAVDIDSEEDFLWAEFLARRGV